ncbi:MAG: HAMP domain-containing sensor histidine kinase [Bacteroidota bacterium]|nr:HAMP domain-containing sensor histidine kinase [Bacteroidota bacterium]
MNQPRKTRILFFVISGYALAAFGWWFYILTQNSREQHDTALQKVYDDALKAKLEIYDCCKDMFDEEQELNIDSLQNYIITYFPDYTLRFLQKPKNSDKENGLLAKIEVNPKAYIFEKIEQKYQRKLTQYVMEGLVFVGLLFWGIYYIYKVVSRRIDVNRQQNNFLLAITHELKTPVASIKLMLETLQKRQLPDQQRTDLLADTLNDTERLGKLVENILMATRIEGGHHNYHFEETNLAGVVEDTVSKFAKGTEKKQSVEALYNDEPFITADRLALGVALSNLLSNAIKYSPEGADLKVELKEQEDYIELNVYDRGQQIDPKEKTKIFEKFYRVGNEETRTNKGTGLGLYIVKQIISSHHATISILKRDGGGNIFVIHFPKESGA